MAAQRMAFNIWWYIVRGNIKEMFNKHFWKSGYVWNDSVGKFLKRWFKCPLVGHKAIENVSNEGEYTHFHCFDCGRYVDNPDEYQFHEMNFYKYCKKLNGVYTEWYNWKLKNDIDGKFKEMDDVMKKAHKVWLCDPRRVYDKYSIPVERL